MPLLKKGRLCQLLAIDYPIIQAGMVWVSGGNLAGHAAKAGVLGVIGAGSMTPELLRQHIQKAQAIAGKKKSALAVNIPLLYKGSAEQIEIASELGINIFITSAGSPKLHTPSLKARGKTVMHVTSSPELAQKCQAAGVDVIIAEGFEAGGHNGRDELTTFALIPQVADAVTIPVVAAGGIGDGRGIAAALALGADGVQMGTRFLMTQESSAHNNFKQRIIKSTAGDTFLMMKKLTPVRLLKNKFYQQVAQLEQQNASAEELQALLGKGRAKRGMLEGDIDEGELEVGQIASMMRDIPTVAQLVERLSLEYNNCAVKM
jgi:enoyl-[acyl-carrier protein] reductase II